MSWIVLKQKTWKHGLPGRFCYTSFKDNHIMDMTNTTFISDFTRTSKSRRKEDGNKEKRTKKLSRGYCSGQ